MNFIRETDPYLRQLDAWKKGHGFSDTEALKRLAAIWDEFKALPERRVVIYPNSNSIAPKTDLSCGSCIHDLLTFVCNWRAALEHEVSTYFEGVQVAEVIEPVKISFDKPQTFPEVIEAYDHDNDIPNGELIYVKPDPNGDIEVLDPAQGLIKVSKVEYLGLKMHQLRSLAKKKQIPYSNKTTSKELIELLNAKV